MEYAPDISSLSNADIISSLSDISNTNTLSFITSVTKLHKNLRLFKINKNNLSPLINQNDIIIGTPPVFNDLMNKIDFGNINIVNTTKGYTYVMILEKSDLKDIFILRTPHFEDTPVLVELNQIQSVSAVICITKSFQI